MPFSRNFKLKISCQKKVKFNGRMQHGMLPVDVQKVDEDCKFCYMYRDSFDNTRYNPLAVVKTKTVFNMPLKLKEPSKIFTCSLADFFHEAIDSYRNEAWDIIRKCPHHTFQILTKRPERIAKNLPADWNENFTNCWIGTSVGSENGKYRYRPCKVEWMEEIAKEFSGCGSAVFVKQMGTYLAKELKMSDRHGGKFEEFPSTLQIREFPQGIRYVCGLPCLFGNLENVRPTNNQKPIEKPQYNTLFVRPNSGKPFVSFCFFLCCGASKLKF